MDTQPKIPTLKDSQKPQVKVRGLGAGVTLSERLKQFKKKDLAFILAGLGILFMAPLAEHFMMSPESGDGTLQQGWGKGGAGGRGMFDGSGGSPYEPGVTGLAPGSAIGGGSDIITPLNVRDPSALVMGPGATQQPPTNSVMPPTAPPTAPATHSDSDLKDALAASARGVGAAGRAARSLLPIPKIALSGGSGLRGLGVVSGGTSASSGGGGVSSAGLVSGKAAGSNSLGNVRAAPGFRGVARGQSSGDTSGMDALKKAAGDAAGAFNRGSANSGLNDAANTAIPNGGGSLGGNGAGGTGSTDKPFGGDQNKDGKNVGESLAFLKQKAIQEAQIALWAKEQEAGDNKLEALKIRNSMAEAITGKIAGAIGDLITCPITSGKGGFAGCFGAGGGATTYTCKDSAGNLQQIAASSVGKSQQDCQSSSSGGNSTPGKLYFTSDNSTLVACSGTVGGNLTGCVTDGSTSSGGKGGGGEKESHSGVEGLGGGLSGIQSNGDVKGLSAVCVSVKTDRAELEKAAAGSSGAAKDKILKPEVVKFYGDLTAAARNLVLARDAMFRGPTGECDATSPLNTTFEGEAYSSALNAASKAQNLTAGLASDEQPNAVSSMKGVVTKNDEVFKADKDIPGAGQLSLAEKHRRSAVAILGEAYESYSNAQIPAVPTDWGSTSAAKARAYIRQLQSAKEALASYKGQIEPFIADGKTLDTQQKLLEKIAGPDAAPTLKRVVATNVAYAKAEGDFKKAAGDTADIKPAAPAGAALGANIDGTTSAIATAEKSVGAGETGAVASVKAFIDEKDTAVRNTKKEKAKTDLATANRDMAQMQSVQTAWLQEIGRTVREVNLPPAPVQ